MGASGSKVWEEPSVSTKGTMFTHARSDSSDFWDSPSYLQPEPGVPIDLRQVSSPQRSGGILRNPFGTPRKKSFKDGEREGGGRASVVGSLVGGTLGTLGTLLHFKGASSNPSQKSSTEGWVPVYLHDRVLAFTYESDAERPAGPEDDRRYWRCLQEGAAFLATQHPDTVLLVNLGPSLLRPELYSLFGNNVCELGTTWGSPPGAAICALDSLFAACASINNWLALDDENVAVLHTRSNFGSRPGTFLRFVAACYLTFSSEFDHCLEAMSSLPRAWEDNYPRFAAGPNGRGSFDSRESEEKGLSRGAASAATAAQRRYCQYFGDVLYAQSVPLRRKGAISLNKVILGACPAVDGTDGCRPYIRVFRRGVEIGSTLKKSEIPARHEASTNWMVPFQLDVPVWGDVSFTVHNWTGNTRKDDACPLFVFSFHTGFIDTGLVRITRRQLDCAYDGEMVIPDEFFIDITLDPSAVNFAVNLEKKRRGDSWSEDMDALAGENVDDHNWKGMLASSYGFEYEETAARENETQQRRAMNLVMTEMKASIAVGSKLRHVQRPSMLPGGVESQEAAEAASPADQDGGSSKSSSHKLSVRNGSSGGGRFSPPKTWESAWSDLVPSPSPFPEPEGQWPLSPTSFPSSPSPFTSSQNTYPVLSTSTYVPYVSSTAQKPQHTADQSSTGVHTEAPSSTGKSHVNDGMPPFRDSTGLQEHPMSPTSAAGAFRRFYSEDQNAYRSSPYEGGPLGLPRLSPGSKATGDLPSFDTTRVEHQSSGRPPVHTPPSHAGLARPRPPLSPALKESLEDETIPPPPSAQEEDKPGGPPAPPTPPPKISTEEGIPAPPPPPPPPPPPGGIPPPPPPPPPPIRPPGGGPPPPPPPPPPGGGPPRPPPPPGGGPPPPPPPPGGGPPPPPPPPGGGPPRPPAPPGGGPPPPPPGKMGNKGLEKAALKGPSLRGLYWTKVNWIQNTVWEEIKADHHLGHLAGSLGDSDLSALKWLFRVRQKKILGPGGLRVKGAQLPGVQLITLTRANNVAIMLTQFKVSHGDLKNIILAGDPDKELTLEKLGLLLQIVPTEEELPLFINFTGDVKSLTYPEQFLSAMAQVPRLRTKIQVMIFMRQFEAMVQETLDALNTVRRGCTQVRSSHMLRAVLAATLATGNELNNGTIRGSAKGVKVDSLLKLADVKVTQVVSTKMPPRRLPNSLKRAAPPPEADAAPTPENSTEEQPPAMDGPMARARTLLEFVAAVVVHEGLVKAGEEMTAEIEALGMASRFTQAELVEALSSLDKGMQAVDDERNQALLGSAAMAGKVGEGKENLMRSPGPVDESKFALRLGDFLDDAREKQQGIIASADQTKAQFRALAVYFGEAPDAIAPEVLLGALWSFALAFDKAQRYVVSGPSKGSDGAANARR